MTIFKTDACKCDYEDCGRVWLPRDGFQLGAPPRCAGCKRTNWNKTGTSSPIVKTTPIVRTEPRISSPIVKIEEAAHTPIVISETDAPKPKLTLSDLLPSFDLDPVIEPKTPCGVASHTGSWGKGLKKNLWYCPQCDETFQRSEA